MIALHATQLIKDLKESETGDRPHDSRAGFSTINSAGTSWPPIPSVQTVMVFRRVLRLWVAFAKFEVTGLAMGAVGWKLYTRNSRFVEYSSADPEFGTPFWRMRNPHNNPPACIDMCERKVPLAKLKTGDEEELVKNFARGVFGGWGFEVQRRMLQEKYRKLEGREKDLWEKEDLERAEYGLGTRIVDHFEVVERTRNKVRPAAVIVPWNMREVLICLAGAIYSRFRCGVVARH